MKMILNSDKKGKKNSLFIIILLVIIAVLSTLAVILAINNLKSEEPMITSGFFAAISNQKGV